MERKEEKKRNLKNTMCAVMGIDTARASGGGGDWRFSPNFPILWVSILLVNTFSTTRHDACSYIDIGMYIHERFSEMSLNIL